MRTTLFSSFIQHNHMSSLVNLMLQQIFRQVKAKFHAFTFSYTLYLNYQMNPCKQIKKKKKWVLTDKLYNTLDIRAKYSWVTWSTKHPQPKCLHANSCTDPAVYCFVGFFFPSFFSTLPLWKSNKTWESLRPERLRWNVQGKILQFQMAQRNCHFLGSQI